MDLSLADVLYAPWQEVADAADSVIGDTLKHVGEYSYGSKP